MQEHYQLQHETTFGVRATARYFTVVTNIDELKAVVASDTFTTNPHIIIGEGSNILFISDYPGLVVKNSITGIAVTNETDTAVEVTAHAGTNWHTLVQFAVQHGFWGIENLSYIPGTVGAAPIQNIGAYGTELKDVFVSLEALDIETGLVKTFDRAACQFGYRWSYFKTTDRYVVISITLRLSKVPNPNLTYPALASYLTGAAPLTLEKISQAVIAIRTSKLPDPKEIGNAGSFFKNPILSADHYRELEEQFDAVPSFPTDGGVKVPAAWLIEQCGMKGITRGRVGTYPQQPLVLINLGGATGEDVVALAEEIQKCVTDRFGVTLEPEVTYVGMLNEQGMIN